MLSNLLLRYSRSTSTILLLLETSKSLIMCLETFCWRSSWGNTLLRSRGLRIRDCAWWYGRSSIADHRCSLISRRWIICASSFWLPLPRTFGGRRGSLWCWLYRSPLKSLLSNNHGALIASRNLSHISNRVNGLRFLWMESRHRCGNWFRLRRCTLALLTCLWWRLCRCDRRWLSICRLLMSESFNNSLFFRAKFVPMR